MSDTGAKRVLVTGAGRGIGRAIALKLASEGFAVSACARTKTDLTELKLDAGKTKNEFRVTELDVTDSKAVASWVKTECAHAGATPWGLVTAAGIHGDIAPFLDCDWAEWKKGLEVNLYGTAHACRFFARELRERKLAGRIALLSGGGATQPIENLTSYCASKSAVVRFGETLAVELKALGITVNSIAPGAINTAITQTILDAGPDKAGKDLYERTLKQVAEGGGSIDKPAALAAYLMSEQSAPVTGKLLSAVWDPWAKLHEPELALVTGDKNMYTLRRTVPAEGKK